jgi:Head domain of trimeric autotransporter adhesin
MKKILLLSSLLTSAFFCTGQYVGIGTTTPQSTLDVKGNHRFGGNSTYMSFDTLSGKMIWWNSYLFAPVSQTLMKHSAAADGLFYNNTAPVSGQLEYRNATGNPVFYTNFINGNGYFKSRLGISVTNPLAGLHVGDSSVLFSATGEIPGVQGLPPVQGAGRRFMWYPDKASFRVGYVDATQWDKDNIGTYSVAMGYGTKASQGYATALGFHTTASGAASTALGNQTTAKAFGSVSIGSLNDFSDNPDPLNVNSTDRIFQIGNGGGAFPSNAMTVLRNGNVGIGSITPEAKLSISANGTELTGAASGTTLRTNAGSLGTTAGSEISLANIGFLSGNNSSLGIRAYRTSAGNEWTSTALVIGYDVDNTVRAAGGGAGFLALHANGNFGIGTATPQYPLDINGRMRLSGNHPYTAGIWLNEAGVERAFVGLKTNNTVGFYGDVTGWGLTMNTTNGAIAINGNTGAAGQVLQSNGSGAFPSWSALAKPYAFTIIPTQFTTLNGALLSANIDEINNTPFTLNQNSTVLYTLTLPVTGQGPATIDSKGYVVIEIVNASSTRVSYASSDYYIKRSTSTTQIATGVALNLPAGVYTIKARLVRLSAGDGDVDTHASFNANQQGIQFIAQILPN